MFVYNVFDENQLSLIHTDLELKLQQLPEWTYTKKWYGQIMDKDGRYLDEHGDIAIKEVSSIIKSLVRKVLIKIDNECRYYDFNAFYQMWDRNSGCGLHKDSLYPFVATFYLNKIWTPNDGGLYVYEEGGAYKMFTPTYNSCNYNTKNTYGLHCVTPITPYARDRRYTIQVFAKT